MAKQIDGSTNRLAPEGTNRVMDTRIEMHARIVRLENEVEQLRADMAEGDRLAAEGKYKEVNDE